MPLPKVPIKYEPVSGLTTSSSPTSGSVVSTTGPGLCPALPTSEATKSYLRGDGAWTILYFQSLAGIPATFPPSPHALTHITGSDKIPLVGVTAGLVPPLPADSTMIFGAAGTWIPIQAVSVPLVSSTTAGIVPATPNDSSYVFGGMGTWVKATGGSGSVPAPPNDATQVLLGTNTWGRLSFAALSNVPATFTPSKHATSHTSGTDIMPLATTTTRGLVPPLPSIGTNVYLRGDNTWGSQAASDVVGTLGYIPANKAGDTFTGLINATAGITLTKVPLYASPPTVALGGPTLQYGAVQIYNPTGDSGSPSISIYKMSTDHSTLVRAVQIGVDVNGVEVSTDLAGPVNLINANGLIPSTALDPTLATFLVPTGAMLDFGGTTAPAGWLLCDGNTYLTAAYPALFAVIQYSYGGSGASFKVPDFRGRVAVGTGQGAGLSNYSIGTNAGEEKHPLTIAELATHNHSITDVQHNHTQNAHTHGMDHVHDLQNHTHLGVDHLHYMNNHTHLGVNHLHNMDHYHNWNIQGSHSHGDQGHGHTYVAPFGSGNNWAAGAGWGNIGGNNTSAGYANLAAANTPAGNTVYASQTSASWVNTGACDRDLTTGGPSSAYTAAADRGLTTAGPSVNNTGWASQWNAAWVNTGAATATNNVNYTGITATNNNGTGTGHNNLQPYLVATKIIKI